MGSTRLKVSITWHEGYTASGWAVETFYGNERTACITGEIDPSDQTQRTLETLARALAESRFPRLF